MGNTVYGGLGSEPEALRPESQKYLIVLRICNVVVMEGHRFINPLTPNDSYSGRTAPLTSKRQQIYVLNILNMVYALLFFSSNCSLLYNFNVFGSCIIHILCTVCAKIKKNNSGAKRLK